MEPQIEHNKPDINNEVFFQNKTSKSGERLMLPNKEYTPPNPEIINQAREKILNTNNSKESDETLKPNEGKKLEIKTSIGGYDRVPAKTPLIMDGDNISEIIFECLNGKLNKDDIVFVSEKIIAISQGRAYKIDDIKPSFLANTLSKFVTKSSRGIGIGSPQTMELALREAGIPRIFLAAFVAIITKTLGIKGMFYRVAGKGVNEIDGACGHTIPPYNKYAVLGPKDPDKVSRQISERLGGTPVVIVDANDYGVRALGRSDKNIKRKWCEEVFKDNPLGQNDQQTPIAIVRKN